MPMAAGYCAGHMGHSDGAPRLHIADSCPEKARIGRAGMDGEDGGSAQGTCDIMTASSVSHILMLCALWHARSDRVASLALKSAAYMAARVGGEVARAVGADTSPCDTHAMLNIEQVVIHHVRRF